ncbi:N-acetylneuraminate lyase B-like [Gigantopelta aegis]|uniref:N-acetylneuraminate lyase B-like n=1 Tax=Gigantopelta aegis TaxID=1735272 RepID=UPI001B88E19B|nr:N-acetylneuraminate lyase B-like [Gigantopelta aegis]
MGMDSASPCFHTGSYSNIGSRASRCTRQPPPAKTSDPATPAKTPPRRKSAAVESQARPVVVTKRKATASPSDQPAKPGPPSQPPKQDMELSEQWSLLAGKLHQRYAQIVKVNLKDVRQLITQPKHEAFQPLPASPTEGDYAVHKVTQAVSNLSIPAIHAAIRRYELHRLSVTTSSPPTSFASKLQDFVVKGIISAPMTPFQPNGDHDVSVLDKYVDHLVNSRIDGVFIHGTMGEGLSLTVNERKEMTEAWVKASKDKLKYVIVQVGTENLRSSMELARHAQSTGVSAIACFSPSYFKPATISALVSYMEHVAESAPDLPFYYYDINFMTNVHLNVREFLEQASSRIPSLRGVKCSSQELPDVFDQANCMDGRFQVLIGTDEQLLPALCLGVQVPVLNSYVGPCFHRLREAFLSGDMDSARKEQKFARSVVRLCTKYGKIIIL